MIVAYNNGARLPDDLAWDQSLGYGTEPTGVAHPCLPMVPVRADELEDWQQGIEADFHRPPNLILYAMHASVWRVTAEISAGDVTLSVDTTFDVDSGNTLRMGHRIAPRHTFGGSFYQQALGGVDDLDFINITISSPAPRVNARPLVYDWDLGLWSVPWDVSVLGGIEGDYFSCGYGTSGYLPSAGGPGGLTLDIVGESITLSWDIVTDIVTVTGTIALTPEEFFPLY